MPRELIDRWPASLCPPSGRGVPGYVVLFAGGMSGWVSELLTVEGVPRHQLEFRANEVMTAKTKWGGRLEFPDKSYLVFGGGKAAIASYLEQFGRELHT